ncbi:Uncharacterised nucleotidyltransferase [Ruminococcaceae bacterium YRB3002]|nr:Uncharacterised nucleotidyltransferase [Ruminococcaceae bacterium YRB3002]
METQDLIYLLSCAVNGMKPDTERVADMDLDAVFALASRNMLAATIAPALKEAGIQDNRFAKALEHSALKSSTMDMEMDALFAELDKAGIWYMPLKGIVLQHLYSIYGMRDCLRCLCQVCDMFSLDTVHMNPSGLDFHQRYGKGIQIRLQGQMRFFLLHNSDL